MCRAADNICEQKHCVCAKGARRGFLSLSEDTTTATQTSAGGARCIQDVKVGAFGRLRWYVCTKTQKKYYETCWKITNNLDKCHYLWYYFYREIQRQKRRIYLIYNKGDFGYEKHS